MSDILVRLIGLGNDIGTVTSANMYDDGYMVIKGHKDDGSKFDITFNLKKENVYDES